MGEKAKFIKQQHGPEVATIFEDDYGVLEMVRLSAGQYDLTVHNRQSDGDRWEDCSVRLKPGHIEAIASLVEPPCDAQRLIDVLRAIATTDMDARQMRNSAVALLVEIGALS